VDQALTTLSHRRLGEHSDSTWVQDLGQELPALEDSEDRDPLEEQEVQDPLEEVQASLEVEEDPLGVRLEVRTEACLGAHPEETLLEEDLPVVTLQGRDQDSTSRRQGG